MRFKIILPILVFGLSVVAHAEEKSLYDAPDRTFSLGERLKQFFGPKSEAIKYDERMIRAAEIAMRRAEPKKTWYCWRYVKNALLAAGLVDSYPSSAWAKQAGDELCHKYGFQKLELRDPYKAPVGAVIVYGGQDAGHVELRSKNGFVSDFVSRTPYPRPLVGIYVKPS
jgi:hypothetical protein